MPYASRNPCAAALMGLHRIVKALICRDWNVANHSLAKAPCEKPVENFRRL